MRELNWEKGKRKKCVMVDGNKKVGKRCLRIFLKRFFFPELRGKIFLFSEFFSILSKPSSS